MLKRAAPDSLDGSPVLMKRRCLDHFASPFHNRFNSNNRHAQMQLHNSLSPQYTVQTMTSSANPNKRSRNSFNHNSDDLYGNPAGIQRLEIDLVRKKHSADLENIKAEATKQIQELKNENEHLKQVVSEQRSIIEKQQKDIKILQHGVRTLDRQLNGEKLLKQTVNQQQEKIRNLEQTLYALRTHLARANSTNSTAGMGFGSGNGHVF